MITYRRIMFALGKTSTTPIRPRFAGIRLLGIEQQVDCGSRLCHGNAVADRCWFFQQLWRRIGQHRRTTRQRHVLQVGSPREPGETADQLSIEDDDD